MRAIIESGSLEPGIAAADFGLPANAGLRYERPHAALAGLITDYHVLDSIEPEGKRTIDWMLPSWAAIRITLSDRPIAVRLGSRVYDPVPVAALYGVTSRAMRVETQGGVTIGIGIAPAGWARLFRDRADAHRDRITPAETLLPADHVAALVSALRRSNRGGEVKAILDDFLRPLTADSHPDERLIEAIAALILSDAPSPVAAAAERVGVSASQFVRVSNRYFGFPPKVLMNRARFLRAFIRIVETGDPTNDRVIGPAYHDRPHFLRDARRFLGMTPRQFMAMDTPYLDAALRARSVVIGQATGAGRS